MALSVDRESNASTILRNHPPVMSKAVLPAGTQFRRQSCWFSGTCAPGRSAGPPDECGAYHIVPDGAHQGSAEPGEQPFRGVVAVDPTRDAHVGNGADRANDLEPEQSGREGPARKPLVAVGQGVV